MKELCVVVCGYLNTLFTKIHIERFVLVADTKVIASEQETESVSLCRPILTTVGRNLEISVKNLEHKTS